MEASNATLTSLWVDEGQGSPLKVLSVARTPSNTSELKDDIRYFKDSSLEPVAKEAGILDTNGEFQQNTLPKGAVQMIAVPVASPCKSPYKVEPQLLPRQVGTPIQHQQTVVSGSPMILGTPQRIITSHVVTQSPHGAQMIATPILESPQQWSTTATTSGGSRKRAHDLAEEFSDGKRGKKGEKGGKGLRHFSMKVCEKVQKKGLTSYNEVADELVGEFSDPRNMSPADQVSHAYDQKNIRRRVYDALNVLMAMNIISKEKKEIRWIGLPTNSAQECQNLELERQRRLDRIKHKTQQLQELILQQIAFKNLVQRNRQLEQTQGTPTANSSIQLPFIIVNTSKRTVIDCSISSDKYEYLFNFDNTFEIHDDIEVLKRMGMAHGLEKGACSAEDLQKAVRTVPKALEPYVRELANVATSSSLTGGGGSALAVAGNSNSKLTSVPHPHHHHQASSLAAATAAASGLLSLDQSADAEVAMATARALSRQSSMGSFSDVAASRESPSEPYSEEESESDRSSPVDVNS